MGHSHGTKWNDELIEKEIKKVMGSLQINRMPSNKEIKIVMDSTKLSNAIGRSGGFYKWASKLNLNIKDSETKFGKEYENITKEILEIKGYKVEQMSVKHPYDLLVNECIKVDVKSSKQYYYTDKNYYYTFNLEKKNATCDLYICCCINNSNELDKLLIIPSKDLKLTQLSIGVKSEYDKYIDRWDLIAKYNKFYQELN